MRFAMTGSRLAFVSVLVVVAGATVFHVQGAQQGDIRTFMRQKLDHSQRALEGLTLENYAMVAGSARAMKELSLDTRWRVSPDVNYLRLSAEFQDLADELAQKAKEKNLDGATLAYVRLTMNCVKCHEYTRDKRITRLDSGSSGRRF